MTDVLAPELTRQYRFRSAVGLETISLFDLIILCLLMVVALVFRLSHVTQPLVDVFSWRQASTAMMSDNFRTGGWNIFFPEVSWTGPGPSYQGREFQLFSYIVAILHAVFGWHDWFGRALATVFGMISVFSLHRLTALVWDERHAHAAAVSYALMPAAIMIDTSYLPDPAMLALITLGIWLFVRYWLTGVFSFLVIASASFTLGVLSKLPGLGVGLIIVFLTVTMALRGETQRALQVTIASAVGLAVIFAWYLWAIYLGTQYPPFHVAGSGYIWESGLAELVANAFYLPSLWNLSIWWLYGYPVLLLFAVGLWGMPYRRLVGADAALEIVPLIWLLSGVIVYVLGAKEITSNPWNLHLLHIPIAIFVGRGFILLVGVGETAIISIRGFVRATILVAMIVGLSTVPLVTSMKDPQGEEARLLGQQLYRLSGGDELVIAVAPEVGDPIGIYYTRGRGWVFPPGGGDFDWSTFGEDGPAAITLLENLHAEGAQWFGVTLNARDRPGRLFLQHYAELLAYLDETATRVADTSVFRIYQLTDLH